MTDNTDDDGMCCKEITIVTRAFRKLNGCDDPADSPLFMEIERVDGHGISFYVSSVERAVEIVRELNPALVHVGALDHERDALMVEIRAHVAGNIVAHAGPRAPDGRALLH